MEIKIHWQVEDGYVGKSRPQTTTVRPFDDFSQDEWDEMNSKERDEYLQECVQNDFDQTISFAIDNIDYDE
jgi:phage-related protein